MSVNSVDSCLITGQSVYRLVGQCGPPGRRARLLMVRSFRLFVLITALATAVGLLLAPARASAAPAPPLATHTVGYDKYSLLIDGQRQLIYAGEFHPFRLPSPDLWVDVLQKFKAAGFNAVTVYFD